MLHKVPETTTQGDREFPDGQGMCVHITRHPSRFFSGFFLLNYKISKIWGIFSLNEKFVKFTPFFIKKFHFSFLVNDKMCQKIHYHPLT